MGKSCTQTYETKKGDLLDPADTDRLASMCEKGDLSSNCGFISNKLVDSTPGFSREALYINGYSPINELVTEIKGKIDDDVKIIEGLSAKIKSDGYSHTTQEVQEFHDAVKEEYDTRVSNFASAVAAYNDAVRNYNKTTANENKTRKPDDQLPTYEDAEIRIVDGDAVEDMIEKHLNKQPTGGIPGADAGRVNETVKKVKEAFDNYVKEYENVIDWKNREGAAPSGESDTSTSTTINTGAGGISINRSYQNFNDLSEDDKKNADTKGGYKVVAKEKKDGSTEYYRYHLGKLIEVNVVDKDGNNHYYTSTGVPATKLDDDPSKGVVPTSVTTDAERSDYWDLINGAHYVFHKIEGGKSVFYTYGISGNLMSVRDDQGNDVNGQALNYDGGNFANTNYEIGDEYRTYNADKMNTAPSNFDDTHVAWEYNDDGSSTYYRYDSDNKLIEVHVVDENGNNYLYDGTGAPASKVGENPDISQRAVIANDVLKGATVESSGIGYGTRVTKNGVTIVYDNYGRFSSATDANNGKPLTDAKGNPIEEKDAIAAINRASSDKA